MTPEARATSLRRARAWLVVFIAGHVRGIPLWWRLVDCSFGVFGALPLLLCRRHVKRLEA